jgi:hypothetical protein
MAKDQHNEGSFTVSGQSRVLNLKNKTVSIEDYAFYLGGQHIPVAEGLNELDHHFRQEQARIEAASVQKQKPLEAVLDRNNAKRPKVEAAWKAMTDLFDHHPPQVAMFYVLAALGVIALVIDAILTGPSLDILYITDPAFQYIAAFGLAAFAAASLHLALESFESTRMSPMNRLGTRIWGLFTVLGLTCWGILRGRQVAFGASLTHNPLGEFLHGHAILSSVVFCLITVGSPLAAAFATGRAAIQIHDVAKWNRARKEHEDLIQTTTEAQKALEAERGATAHKLNELDALKSEWQSCFMLHHDRGRIRGARQEPFWTVIVRSCFCGLIALLPTILLAHFIGWYALAVPVIVTLIALVHFRRRWLTPSYEEFRKTENTRFAVPARRPAVIEPEEPLTLEATVEDRDDREKDS